MALSKVLGNRFRIRGGMSVPKTQRDGKLHTTVLEPFLPDELPAVWAVRWLSQVGSHEFVPVHLMHSPSHRTLAFPSEVLKNSIPLEGPCEDKRKKTTNHLHDHAQLLLLFLLWHKGHNYIPGLEVRGPHSRTRRTSGKGNRESQLQRPF